MPRTEDYLADPLEVWDGGDEYRAPTVIRLAGISYRQLDYWARNGLVTPSVQAAHGSGSHRVYNFEDLVELRIVAALAAMQRPLAGVNGIRQALDVYRTRRDDRGTARGIYLISDPVHGWDADYLDGMDFADVSIVTVLSVDWIRLDLEKDLLPFEQAHRLRELASV